MIPACGSHTVSISAVCGGLSAEPGADNAPHEAREPLIPGPIPCMAGLSPIDLVTGGPMRAQKRPIQLVRDLCGMDTRIRFEAIEAKGSDKKGLASIFDLPPST